MFCPDCGANNVSGQKFCTRCGTNLIAIDRAREFVQEISSGAPVPVVSPSAILWIVALVSIIGFIATTIGIVALLELDETHGPIPVMFGIGGFATIILICRYLLNTLKQSAKPEPKPIAPAYASPSAVRGATNRSLNQAQVGYQSIIEDPTKQFEAARKNRQD